MTDYGFASTDDVQYDKQGLPVGDNMLVMITDEEVKETDKAENPKMLIVEFELLDGVHKGKKAKVWYNLWHTNQQTANIAKQSIKRIADATGKAVAPTAPLKGRVMRIDVRTQKKNPDYTEIAKYWPEDHQSSNAPF